MIITTNNKILASDNEVQRMAMMINGYCIQLVMISSACDGDARQLALLHLTTGTYRSWLLLLVGYKLNTINGIVFFFFF